VSYFERRYSADPDELADETFTRIGRTLEKEGGIMIRPPTKYCYVVARFVLLEHFRRQRKHVRLCQSSMVDAPRASAFLRNVACDDSGAVLEHRMDCLNRCLQKLAPDQRELVVDYYRDSHRQKIERRRAMACRLGITINALAIRMYRIRETLTACLECCGPANCGSCEPVVGLGE
jgi:DNA-directed RNA polymerase specialized sigma24 family protein